MNDASFDIELAIADNFGFELNPLKVHIIALQSWTVILS